MYDMYIRIVARMHAHTHKSYAHHVHRARMMYASCTHHMRIIAHDARGMHTSSECMRAVSCACCAPTNA